MKKIKVKKSAAKQRLDIFLAEELKQSRSQVQKLIKQKLVFINDKEGSAHYKIKEDDKVAIKTAKTSAAETKQKKNLPKLKIVQETDDYLVINKPAGVIIHGGEGINEATLTDALEKKYPAIIKIGDDPLRPGIVHRLDKESSGLLVVAKTNEMFLHLKKQFQTRKIIKKYTALVYEKIDKEEDKINFPISRSAKGYKMAAHANNQTGRQAITEFTVAKEFINYTLLNVKIKTGRTHQIRVHMSAYGHPVVGDHLYGTRKTKEKNDKLGLNRIFLHADYLAFKNLEGEQQEFEIKLPVELKKVLEIIK